jgi:primosomal protein N' (replication factor Y)
VSRVCRVCPDVPALDRTFDYLVPDALAGAVTVGTIVRVPLHGRRVRGWVVEDGVEPETEPSRLLPLAKVVGAGPPPDVVELAAWAAWRWAGPHAVLLRAASPPNAVHGAPPDRFLRRPRAYTAPGRRQNGELWAWPPAGDRRDLVAERIAEDGSTIVLVPDPTRLGSLRRRLEADGHRMLELYGTAPAAVRTRAWDGARTGGCVVVGGRVAVWAPVPDLAAVIVLDEGDEALQEERAPTWHGRDVLVERARRTGAAITLVAASPTLEAEHIAGPPRRPERTVERDGWPIVEVVDPRDEAPGTGLLTEPLARALRQVVDRDERAVCVLNRRGRARLLACTICHELARCERCGALVAEEEDTAGNRVLRCASCGFERPVVCLHCHGTRMKALRPGVARVRDDLAALLPRTDVVEVDAATGELAPAPVYVGTEAVLHRLPPGPRLGLAAFLDFDQELLAPRYRAAEQAMALLVRAARRLGPRVNGGRLLVQTRLPGHEVLDAVRRADPTPVAAAERPRRELLGYPPFGALAEVRGAAEAVRALLDGLRAHQDVDVLGPSAAPTGLEALLHAPSTDALAGALAATAPAARAAGRIRIAVDPPRV